MLFQLSEEDNEMFKILKAVSTRAMATTTRGRSGRPVSTAGSKKVIERLRAKIEDGSFYEAHQTYKALYQRFCAQGSEERAISLLLEGASTLLKHEQVNA